MTQQEAQALWDARGPQWAIRPTVEQDAYVLALWNRMPRAGARCWMDAFLVILHGEQEKYGGAPTASEVAELMSCAQQRAARK